MKKFAYLLPAAMIMFTSCAQQDMSAFFPEAEQEANDYRTDHLVPQVASSDQHLGEATPAYVTLTDGEARTTVEEDPRTHPEPIYIGETAIDRSVTLEDDPGNHPEPTYRGEEQKDPASEMGIDPGQTNPQVPSPGPKRPAQTEVARTN